MLLQPSLPSNVAINKARLGVTKFHWHLVLLLLLLPLAEFGIQLHCC
jgi:hypothetical protein